MEQLSRHLVFLGSLSLFKNWTCLTAPPYYLHIHPEYFSRGGPGGNVGRSRYVLLTVRYEYNDGGKSFWELFKMVPRNLWELDLEIWIQLLRPAPVELHQKEITQISHYFKIITNS